MGDAGAAGGGISAMFGCCGTLGAVLYHRGFLEEMNPSCPKDGSAQSLPGEGLCEQAGAAWGGVMGPVAFEM